MSYERQDYKREEQHHEKQSGESGTLRGALGRLDPPQVSPFCTCP